MTSDADFLARIFFDRAVLLRFHARQELGCFKEMGKGLPCILALVSCWLAQPEERLAGLVSLWLSAVPRLGSLSMTAITRRCLRSYGRLHDPASDGRGRHQHGMADASVTDLRK